MKGHIEPGIWEVGEPFSVYGGAERFITCPNGHTFNIFLSNHDWANHKSWPVPHRCETCQRNRNILAEESDGMSPIAGAE